MKTKINGMIVLEGQSDIDFLSSFIEADFYKVNGSAINKKDIEYLTKISKNESIIILTDPDFPGEQIRQKINENIPNCLNAYVRKEVSIKNKKVGVAESTKEEVLLSLKNMKTFKKTTISNIKLEDLYLLGLTGKDNSSILRKKVCDSLHIGFSNGKSLLNKLNSLGTTYEEIEGIINNVNN